MTRFNYLSSTFVHVLVVAVPSTYLLPLCLLACRAATKVLHCCLLWAGGRMVPQLCLRVSNSLPTLTFIWVSSYVSGGPSHPVVMVSFAAVSVTKTSLWDWVVSPVPNPQTWRANGSLFVRPLPFDLSGFWCPSQETKSPVGIALRVIKTHKPLDHDKAVIPRGVVVAV